MLVWKSLPWKQSCSPAGAPSARSARPDRRTDVVPHDHVRVVHSRWSRLGSTAMPYVRWSSTTLFTTVRHLPGDDDPDAERRVLVVLGGALSSLLS